MQHVVDLNLILVVEVNQTFALRGKQHCLDVVQKHVRLGYEIGFAVNLLKQRYFDERGLCAVGTHDYADGAFSDGLFGLLVRPGEALGLQDF